MLFLAMHGPWGIEGARRTPISAVILGDTLGFGEAYMDGWSDAPAIDQMFERLMGDDAHNQLLVLRA